ncbi:hypothetical protein ABB37_07431 [Leptomonas pyrrhocoris]|uniref:Uncharacterized protein n=1 Tax=Leptomonas pyrrhocoris TaxID=157538 RepID=A0A0M9FW51_LEPPY|nr:hypothetical protein ABB37_07431 [Leptomonas pyrrhocoris]KPA77116.1 hypothetical protein ABB37_07431 [Leptomonas pyrrhocoris]|eukprot:XP_015655555.1 hypothetical protein ABB37_07431 [Leptomonas pyrrhocoris]
MKDADKSEVGEPAQKAAVVAAKSAREPFILAAAFLDGMVAVSGVPVMVKQGAFVSFPSGASLAAYQLCFFLPQLLTTLAAEQLTPHFDALALLLFTLVCTTGSAVVVSLSLSHRALYLFFASRFLNGVLRHDKTYFGITGTALHMSAAELGAAARYGMMAGMAVSGLAGDVLEDAIEVAQFFALVEILATVLVLVRYLRGRHVTSPVRTRLEYAKWLPSLWRASPAAHHTLVALAAVLVAASVNQVAYPLMGPEYQLPYTFTGAHLCFNMAVQMVWMPHILKWAMQRAATWKSNLLLSGTAEDKLTVVSAALLLAGCVAAPYATTHSPLLYYTVSTLLVDVPAGVLTSLATAAAQASLDKFSGDSAKVGLLIAHATQLTKSFAAPLRISMGDYYHDRKHTVRLVSLPLMAYTLVYARTHSVAYSVAALAMMAFYMVSSTNATSDGDL